MLITTERRASCSMFAGSCKHSITLTLTLAYYLHS